MMKKQMTKNMLLVCLFLAALCTLESCRKQAPVPQGVSPIPRTLRTNEQPYSIVNGILVFTNADALFDRINDLAKLSAAELDAYNSGQSNFTSLYRQYQLMDEAAENETGISASEAISRKEIAFIPDDYFASLVNKDGLLAVGNQVFKYNTDDWQSCPIEHLNAISTYSWANEVKQSYKKESPNYGNPEWASFPPVSRMFYKDNNEVTWPKSNGREVRAVHTTWCSWFGVYSSAGNKIKMEKKSRLGGWVNIDHNSAANACLSDFRYYTLFGGSSSGGSSSGSGSYWGWDLYSKTESKLTTSQHVNQLVLTHRTSALAGALQHKVGSFVSMVSIYFDGHAKNDSWIH